MGFSDLVTLFVGVVSNRGITQESARGSIELPGFSLPRRQVHPGEGDRLHQASRRKTNPHRAVEPLFGWGKEGLNSLDQPGLTCSSGVVLSSACRSHGRRACVLFSGHWLNGDNCHRKFVSLLILSLGDQNAFSLASGYNCERRTVLSIPYIGYLELDIELCGRVLSGCGVLVVRDPPGGLAGRVPGVLGMNVLGRCYQELFGQHGSALFELPVVSQAPSFITAGTTTLSSGGH